jgi:hypothetical protein
MKFITSLFILIICIHVQAQDLTLEHGFKVDEVLVGLDYIFGDVPESVLYFSHTHQISDPVGMHIPSDGIDASLYLMEDGEPSFAFSLDGGPDSVRMIAIGSNKALSRDYLYFQSGSNVKAIEEDDEVRFDLDFRESSNYVLLHIDNSSDILVSYLEAPENYLTKIIAMDSATLITGTFKDTLTYTDPAGEVHKYFTNDIYNGFLLSVDGNGKPNWIHTSRAVGFSLVRTVSAGEVIAYAHDVLFGTQLDILNLDGDTLSTRYLNNVSIMHIEAFEDNTLAMCGNYYRTNNVPDMDFGAGELILPDPIDKDAFVIKYDEDLNVMWYDVIGGDAIDTATKFDFDEQGGLYLTGCIQADGIFNNGGEVYIAQGLEDIFLTYYSPDGIYQWSRVWGGDGTDIGLNIHVEDLQIYLSGVFRETMDVDLKEEEEFILMDNVDALDEAFFYTVYSIDGPSSTKNFDEKKTVVYPNPFKDRISLREELKNVEIYTMTGKLLFEKENVKEINFNFLPSGIYLLQGSRVNGNIISELITKLD